MPCPGPRHASFLTAPQLGLDHCPPPPAWCLPFWNFPPITLPGIRPLPTSSDANAYQEYLSLDLTQVPLPGNLSFYSTAQREKRIWARLAE